MKRLWRAAECQAQGLESRLAEATGDPAAQERDARLLAALVKTLAELSALEDGRTEQGDDRHGARNAAEQHDHSGDDGTGVGIDEFRRELARRLAALADAEGGATAGGTDGAIP
jgi:hypothetical protein